MPIITIPVEIAARECFDTIAREGLTAFGALAYVYRFACYTGADLDELLEAIVRVGRESGSHQVVHPPVEVVELDERQAEEPEAEKRTPGWTLMAAAPSPVFALCNEQNSILLHRQRLEPDDD